MNSGDIVKKELLRRKVNEYFSKHPKSKSVVVNIGEGNTRTVWKASKEKDGVKVVEVNTKRNEFIIDQSKKKLTESKKVLTEVSIEFSNISRNFTTAMASPFDHMRLDAARRSIQTDIGKLTDANERNQAGAMIGALTSMVDSTTAMAGGGTKVTIAHKSRSGKMLKEAPYQDFEDPEEPQDPVGMEQQPTLDTDQAPDAPSPEDTSQDVDPVKPEESFVNKSLEGHTIKSANIELSPGGGSLTLQLVTVENPAKLQWRADGRVIFSFKGRKHVIKNGQ